MLAAKNHLPYPEMKYCRAAVTDIYCPAARAMQQFPLIDYIPWFGSAAVEIFVVAVMVWRHLARRFPAFFISVSFAVLRQITLMAVAHEGARSYGVAYWTTLPIEYVIAFGVMLEAFRYALGADPKIPAKTLRAMVLVAAILVALATFLLLYPDHPTNNLRGLILALDRSIGLLRCAVLIFMWAFARKLGLSWRHHVWGIVLGLGIYASVGLIAAAIHATTGNLCGDWPARLTHFSYLAATIIWAVYLWRPEPERGPLTLEEISFASNSVATYRRILADLWRSFRDDGTR
jgi:hypothetical protein